METAEQLWQAFLKAHPEALSGKLSLAEINRKMAAFVKRLNERPNPDFDGLSPSQMHFVLHDPFNPQSPVRPKDHYPDEVLDRVLFFGLMETLYAELEARGQIRLTPKGNLPLDVCRRLYERKLLTQDDIESGTTKRVSEDNVVFIQALKACLSLGGLVKKRDNAFSFTQAGQKTLARGRSALFVQLLRDYTSRFSWAYLDGADAPQAGQMGWAYSLRLLHRYGTDWQPADFFSERFLRAFPVFNQPVPSTVFANAHIPFASVYEWRFLKKFAPWFGLVELKLRKDLGVVPYPLWVRSTPLLDELFTFEK
jgi:hypothetical protein